MIDTDKEMIFANYLADFTDDVGIFQHSKYGIADLSKGYTTDDNSRALILAVLLFEKYRRRNYLKLINKYLAFMLYAQNEDGKFKNFMNYQRQFLETEGSEDCFGRCIWALGRTICSPAIPQNIKNGCEHMIGKALANWPNLTSSRSKASAVVGLSYLADRIPVSALIEQLSASLVDLYENNKSGDWHWFEDFLTYGNAFLPWSMFRAYQVLNKVSLLKTGQESMDFLGRSTMKEKYFKPIGCNGWYYKGETAAEFDEQPIEACETLLAYLGCYEITGDKNDLDKAIKCYAWYLGENSRGLSLIDQETGACYDGLQEKGLNYNQGSESIISLGIAAMTINQWPKEKAAYLRKRCL